MPAEGTHGYEASSPPLVETTCHHDAATASAAPVKTTATCLIFLPTHTPVKQTTEAAKGKKTIVEGGKASEVERDRYGETTLSSRPCPVETQPTGTPRLSLMYSR